jgi:hypothetical protein
MERPRRLVSYLLVVVALAVSSCSMIGTVAHFEPVLGRESSPDVRVHHYMTSERLGFCVGGDGVGFEVTRPDGKLLVSSPSYSWDQDFMGPILPILPVLVGAGTYRPTVELRIEAIDAATPLLLRREQLTIRAGGSDEDVIPSIWTKDGEPISDDSIALSEGTELSLTYPTQNRATTAFQLRLPRGSDVAEGDTILLRFEHTRSRFFLFALL